MLGKELHVVKMANQLRQDVELEPHDRVPNIVDVVRTLEYSYNEDYFGDDFSGYSQLVNNIDGVIGFNLDHYFSEGFRRFTVTHELGHLTIPSHKNKLFRGSVIHHSAPYAGWRKQCEGEADLFAISFLAPKVATRDKIRNYDYTRVNVSAVAEHFGISFFAAARRFLEITEQACVMVLVDNKGKIKFDYRSTAFRQQFPNAGQIKGERIRETSHTYDVLSSSALDEQVNVTLLDWYPLLELHTECVESVQKMNFNESWITMLTVCDDFF